MAAKAGRKTKRTPEVVEAICRYLRLGCPRGTSARAVGIHPDTFSAWMRFPDFADAVKGAEAEFVALKVGQIGKAASDGTWQAAAWLLERRYPGTFGARTRVLLEQLTDEQIVRLLTREAVEGGEEEGPHSPEPEDA